MKRRHTVFTDDSDHRFQSAPADAIGKRLEIVQQGTARHIELHPELAYLFCEHGAYVGAHGALKYLCPHCNGDLVS